MMSEDYPSALAKIRPHTTSKQAHQRKPAQLLVALESTLDQTDAETSTRHNPTAYFAALITTLEGCLSKGDTALEDGDTLPAVLYLLALTVPFVSSTVLRTNSARLLQLLPSILPLTTHDHAPPLRSMITIFGAILASLDQGMIQATIMTSGSAATSTSISIRQIFSTLLELTLDPRPKVRKRAGEVVKSILDTPPFPLAVHPWSILVAEWSCTVVAQSADAVGQSAGKKGVANNGTERLIHLLAFLRTTPSIFTAPNEDRGKSSEGSTLETMTRYLLAMPKLSNPYLTQASYQLLTSFFSVEDEEEEEDVAERRRAKSKNVLSTLVQAAPLKNDVQIAPYWLAVVAAACASAFSDTYKSSTTPKEVLDVWNLMWTYLDSSCAAATHEAAADALMLLASSGCFSTSELQTGGNGVKAIVELVEKSLSQLAYASSIKEILDVLAALLTTSSPFDAKARKVNKADPTKLHKKMEQSSPFIPLLAAMVRLRNTKGFEHKEAIDQVLTAFVKTIGVDGVISRVPLGLLPKERAASSTQPNAYLLPLIPSQHPTPLSHFVSYFIPLSESLWELAQNSEKEAEQKVYRVLMDQVWAMFPSYCAGCWDTCQTFNNQLAERLTQVLYNEPTLRPPILRGLKAIVESNLIVTKQANGSDCDDDQVTQGHMLPLFDAHVARKNLAHLNSQAKSWLAVLFNVFTSVEKDGRSMVGDVIGVWASIANEPELAGAYRNVLSHLNQNLSVTTSQSKEQEKAVKTLTQMLDILLLLLPYLPAPQLREVAKLCLEKGVLTHPDGSVQKLGYRVLTRTIVRLLEIPTVDEVEKQTMVVKILTDLETSNEVAAGAVKERLGCLSALISHLPTNSLHLVVSHLMEAIMGVKEHSEKSRKAAFELLVVMGQKMREGGTLRMDIVESSASGGTGEERQANVEEYIKMVGASLAAERDHTISAGVMSLSRVLFEFRNDISEETQGQILLTVYPLLAVKNREIVKSVLGFVKLTIHSLPSDIVHAHLELLVSNLITCLSIHKHHFKVKIRHILERLIRKFGWEEVEGHASASASGEGMEGAMKMLGNMRKRKERAARKRREAAAGEGDESDEHTNARAKTGDAFEDVLYGSDSESEDSEAEENQKEKSAARSRDATSKIRKKNLMDHATRLRADDDEPMDLLEGAAGKLANTAQARRRQPGKEASKFRVDEDTGKMIIHESDSEDDEARLKLKHTSKKSAVDGQKVSIEDALAGGAYKDTLISVDGFTRNPNGTIKFHKDTKKRRREEMEMGDEDVEMADAEHTGNKGSIGDGKADKRPKKPLKLGHEFKAKKAGGDVKKNGIDPYGYVSLSQASGGKKGRGKNKVAILGK